VTPRLLGLFTAAVLWLALGVSYANSSFEECRDLDGVELRSEIHRLTQTFFATDLQTLNLERMVHTRWVGLGMDNLIRVEVARAAWTVREDTSYWTRFMSSWSAAKAGELTERVATLAFGSEAFRQGIESLAAGVAQDLSRRFEATAGRSSSLAALCLQEFIGGAYGDTALGVFEHELIQRTLELDPAIELSRLNVSLSAWSGLGVATIIGGHVARGVVQRISTGLSRRIAGRIAVRIAGRAGSAAIPVVGWVVGVAMIAYDLFDGSSGALTAIEAQLISEEVQSEIRREVVLVLEDELPAASAEMAREIADEVYFQWQDFRGNFETVLTVAGDSPEFRQFLDRSDAGDFYKLSQLAEVVGEEGLQEAFGEGTLARMLALPESAMEILAATRSIPVVIAWSEVARGNLNGVVTFEIYKHKSPEDFTPAGLERLVRLNDQETIAKLILLDSDQLDRVLSVSLANLNALGKRLSADDFTYLAWYLERLDQPSANVLIGSWIDNPGAVQRFKSETVQQGITESKSPPQAIRFVASDASSRSMLGDVLRLISGDISRGLFLSQYGLAQTLTFFALLLIAVLLLLALIIFAVGLIAGRGQSALRRMGSP
jgi:hypothetical protein